MHRIVLACAASGIVLAAAPARAAIVEGTLAFQAFNFTLASDAAGNDVNAVAPVSPVTGFVHYRFDNSASFMFQADGAIVNGVELDVSAWGFNIPWNGVLSVSYLKAPPNPLNVYDTLAFSQAPDTHVDWGVDDCRLMVSGISVNPAFLQFWYAPANDRIAYGAFGPDGGAVRERSASTYVPPTALAMVHAALGEPGPALDALERAYMLRDTRLIMLKDDPSWAALRGTPRFEALRRRLRLDGLGAGLTSV